MAPHLLAAYASCQARRRFLRGRHEAFGWLHPLGNSKGIGPYLHRVQWSLRPVRGLAKEGQNDPQGSVAEGVWHGVQTMMDCPAASDGLEEGFRVVQHRPRAAWHFGHLHDISINSKTSVFAIILCTTLAQGERNYFTASPFRHEPRPHWHIIGL